MVCGLRLRNYQVVVEVTQGKAFDEPETFQAGVSAKLRLEYVAIAFTGVYSVQFSLARGFGVI